MVEVISGKRFELQYADGKQSQLVETMRAPPTVEFNNGVPWVIPQPQPKGGVRECAAAR